MTREQMYDLIGNTKTIEDLKNVVVRIFGRYGVVGDHRPHSVEDTLKHIDSFKQEWDKGEREFFTYMPTRQYGIRQHLLYLLVLPRRLDTKLNGSSVPYEGHKSETLSHKLKP